MLIISCQQRITERSLYSLLFYETKTIISTLIRKNLFSSPSGFTSIVSLIWKGIWLVQASLAVFINQDNPYQQKKQGKMLWQHKWDMKNIFQRYNTNEKHKTIIFFPEWFICSWWIFQNLFHSQDIQGLQRCISILALES